MVDENEMTFPGAEEQSALVEKLRLDLPFKYHVRQREDVLLRQKVRKMKDF
jgi:hypothetical protein